MSRKLTRVIRPVKKHGKKVKSKTGRKGYDMSYRANGPRPESKSAQNARYN